MPTMGKERERGKKVSSLPSAFGGGGFLVAQLVRMLRFPSHCPFMAVMADSASCMVVKNEEVNENPAW